MRNDSRPLGEQSPGSPFGGPEDRPIESERPDSRDTIAHGRESHIIHPETERNEPSEPDDPVMPQNDATLKTRI